jgi:heptosyltransferase III
MTPPKIFRYSLNQKLRRAAHWVIRLVTRGSKEERLDLRQQQLKKILIVRANFRMGNSILAIPAILSFRKQFPDARIDFVGAPISKKLFHSLPIDHHFSITRRYPGSGWDYPLLLWRLRSIGYDLAADVSCSQSAMGSFIVGFSRARFRVGIEGKWDRLFNVRIARPPQKNKYTVLAALLEKLGLESDTYLPLLGLSSVEKEKGRKKILALSGCASGRRTVGVFVGGRRTWGKRWPLRNFCELITALYQEDLNVVTFVGPEEKDSIADLRDALESEIAIVFEPSLRDFAAMISNCDLFVTCDSGPMHLACGLGIRTVAIFQNPNFDHWGPPSSVARIVYQRGGCTAEEVFRICLEELSMSFTPVRDVIRGDVRKNSSAVTEAVQRLEKAAALQRLLFSSRCAQGFFVFSLLLYAWFFRPSDIFAEGKWAEQLTDMLGFGTLIAGSLLRLWAVSHGGNEARLHRPQALESVTTGPYARMRQPLYVANLLIGAGMIFLSDAFIFAALLLALFAWHHSVIIPAEEEFLKEKFGERFVAYCDSVPKYIPLTTSIRGFSFGSHFPAAELATLGGIMSAAFVFEWIESPLNRSWLFGVYHMLMS